MERMKELIDSLENNLDSDGINGYEYLFREMRALLEPTTTLFAIRDKVSGEILTQYIYKDSERAVTCMDWNDLPKSKYEPVRLDITITVEEGS